MAIIAGVKLGIYSSYEEAVKKACTFRRTYEPNLQRTKKYDLLYELFRQVRVAQPADLGLPSSDEQENSGHQ